MWKVKKYENIIPHKIEKSKIQRKRAVWSACEALGGCAEVSGHSPDSKGMDTADINPSETSAWSQGYI